MEFCTVHFKLTEFYLHALLPQQVNNWCKTSFTNLKHHSKFTLHNLDSWKSQPQGSLCASAENRTSTRHKLGLNHDLYDTILNGRTVVLTLFSSNFWRYKSLKSTPPTLWYHNVVDPHCAGGSASSTGSSWNWWNERHCHLAVLANCSKYVTGRFFSDLIRNKGWSFL
jgi:hypothetical protein